MRQRERRERRGPVSVAPVTLSEHRRGSDAVEGVPRILGGAGVSPAGVSPATILALQRAIGNAAVAGLVGQAQRSAVPEVLGSAGTPFAAPVRSEDPTDRFERAAETNAHRVMLGPVPEWEVGHDAEGEVGSGVGGGGGGEMTNVQRVLMVDDEKKSTFAEVKDWFDDEVEESTSTSTSASSAASASTSSVATSSKAKAADVPAGTVLAKEIIERYIASGTVFEFTMSELINDVTMRLTLIKFMDYVNGEESPYSYNLDTDEWSMPDTWKGTAAQEDEDDEKGKKKSKPKDIEADAGVAFVPVGDSYEAVMDMFKRTADDGDYFADCSTTIIALHYRALAEAIGKNDFNRKYQGKTALAPAGVMAKIGGEYTHLPILDDDYGDIVVVPNKSIDSAEMLVPGDWVYFENYSDYEATHEGPSAAWAGEHSLYLGGSKFQGFGTESLTYDEMVAKLRKCYNVQGKKTGAKTREKLEECERAIGGFLPGITEVRRLKPQE